jgi:hypothetical protein
VRAGFHRHRSIRGSRKVASSVALLDAWSLIDYVKQGLVDDITLSNQPLGVPGPVIGTGLPGLIAACGSLLAWWGVRKSLEHPPRDRTTLTVRCVSPLVALSWLNLPCALKAAIGI